jgi:hypothetical protein
MGPKSRISLRERPRAVKLDGGQSKGYWPLAPVACSRLRNGIVEALPTPSLTPEERALRVILGRPCFPKFQASIGKANGRDQRAAGALRRAALNHRHLRADAHRAHRAPLVNLRLQDDRPPNGRRGTAVLIELLSIRPWPRELPRLNVRVGH